MNDKFTFRQYEIISRKIFSALVSSLYRRSRTASDIDAVDDSDVLIIFLKNKNNIYTYILF